MKTQAQIAATLNITYLAMQDIIDWCLRHCGNDTAAIAALGRSVIAETLSIIIDWCLRHCGNDTAAIAALGRSVIAETLSIIIAHFLRYIKMLCI